MLLSQASPEPRVFDSRLGGLRLDELHSFLFLADELHFRRAAERLFLTTGGLSRRVTNLESTLRLPLLVRTTRTVELTPSGVRFAALGRILLRELASLPDVLSYDRHIPNAHDHGIPGVALLPRCGGRGLGIA